MNSERRKFTWQCDMWLDDSLLSGSEDVLFRDKPHTGVRIEVHYTDYRLDPSNGGRSNVMTSRPSVIVRLHCKMLNLYNLYTFDDHYMATCTDSIFNIRIHVWCSIGGWHIMYD